MRILPLPHLKCSHPTANSPHLCQTRTRWGQIATGSVSSTNRRGPDQHVHRLLSTGPWH